MKTKQLLITIAAALCMMTQTALAQEVNNGKAIQLGTGGISGYSTATSYDYIYYGYWNAPDDRTTSGPIKWIVLDDQTNTQGEGLFLLSKVLFGSGYSGGISFDNTRDPISNAWQGSDAQAWCNSFYATYLTTQEQGAVLATTKSDDYYTTSKSTYVRQFAASENILNNDKVFFLSAKEAETDAYGLGTNADRMANYGNSAKSWWLRSPYAKFSDCAGNVTSTGDIAYQMTSNGWTARPAFNLNTNSVLFTSSAESGKSADGMDSGLTAVGNYEGREWKLTILDTNRNFSVTESEAESEALGTVTLNYAGATIYNAENAPNEYISAIIADNSGALYYGRIMQPTEASGEITITIPLSLLVGDYTLYVFSEQYNGDYNTDYASAFAKVDLTVTEHTHRYGADWKADAQKHWHECPCGEKTEIGNHEFVNGQNGQDICSVCLYAGYALSVELNGGSASTTGGAYVEGSVISIDAGTRQGYRFVGWTSSNGGSFGDASSASTNFTMPAAKTTIMANWWYNADTGKSIQLGTSCISSYSDTDGYDYIYYGNWDDPNSQATLGPIKWRVLSTNGNNGTYNDGTNTVNASNAMFLLSEELCGSVYFYYSTGSSSKAWQGSNAQKWCNSFLSGYLTTQEQHAVLATTKSDEAYASTSHTSGMQFAASENILSDDKVFFLSVEEVENGTYGFINDAARIANYGNNARDWWLRSPAASGMAAAVIGNNGKASHYALSLRLPARPAFNLNMKTILFTSAAVGGKSASGMDSGLTAIDSYDGSEWKSTIVDISRNFSVMETETKIEAGGTITLNYTGATVYDANNAPNEYISAIIANNGVAQYYGRIMQPTNTDGQVQITIPASVKDGIYTLYVFSEQYNGGENDDTKLTDYASAFDAVSITVGKTSNPSAIAETQEITVYAHNGRIYVDAEEYAIYNLIGQNVTTLNGSLHGLYVVVVEGSVVKIRVN